MGVHSCEDIFYIFKVNLNSVTINAPLIGSTLTGVELNVDCVLYFEGHHVIISPIPSSLLHVLSLHSTFNLKIHCAAVEIYNVQIDVRPYVPSGM